MHLPGHNLPGAFNKLGTVCYCWILLRGHLLTKLSIYNILSRVCIKQLKVLVKGTCILTLASLGAAPKAAYVFDKVFASFWHLTRKNLHKNKMHVN